MNSVQYESLGWLTECEDFRGKCRAILEGDRPLGLDLRRLAGHALTTSQLQRLSTLLDTVEAKGLPTAPLTPLKVGILGSGTLTLVTPVLRATGLRYGLQLTCVAAGYGQIEQEVLDPGSQINMAQCDVIFVALDYRALPLGKPATDEHDASRKLAESIGMLRDICAGIRANGSASIILQTLAPPTETLFGSFDARFAGSVSSMVAKFNQAIVEECALVGTVLFDCAHLANTVGLANWHDAAQWNLAKFPFSVNFLPLYADHVGRLLGAMRGKARRVLVLDLDNTLWGGVIGDDGVHGIVLGEGDPTGEAFVQVQQMALALRARGVVLAVCSKNMDEAARLPFRNHPDMLLQEHHIASFKANWENKAANIVEISQELSLGLDAFVFLDDNPVERALVRHYLPEVAVPELPEDAAYYPRVLAAAGYFEATSFSREDSVRAEYYQENIARSSLMKASGSIDQFLSSLAMRATLSPFDAIGRSRIHQLILKSNQFNLTTNRYTETQIAQLEADPSVFTLQVRLSDRLGDNGMISVVICRASDAQTWVIDTWLMSCRVLKRGVEKLVLKEIVEQARARGIQTLLGTYRPTSRNALVMDHYSTLGFAACGEGDDGETFWTLPTSSTIEAPWFEITRDSAINLAA